MARLSLRDRLLRHTKVNSSTGCWDWMGCKSRGYGKITMPFKRTPGKTNSYRAHRVSYELFRGAIPEGMVVLHKCDNPGCVSPDHLFLGTQKQNVDDCARKGRRADPLRGEHGPLSKLTEKDVKWIKRLCGRGGVTCRAAAARLSVSSGLISHIVSGRAWAHVR